MSTTGYIVIGLVIIFAIMIINTSNKKFDENDEKEKQIIKNEVRTNKINIENIKLDKEEDKYALYLAKELGVEEYKQAEDIVRILKVGITYGDKKALETLDNFINNSDMSFGIKMLFYCSTVNLMETNGILKQGEAEPLNKAFTEKMILESGKMAKEEAMKALRNAEATRSDRPQRQ